MKFNFDPGKVATNLNKHSIPSFTSLQPSNVHIGLRRCTSLRALFSRVQHMHGLDVRTGGEQPLDRGAADREHPLLLLRISSQVAVAFQGLQP
jgi:hypothetical protein